MALKQQKQTTRPNPGLETQGPVNADNGYNPSPLPTNPSDEIFMGRALPVRGPQDVTGRRDFSIPIKPTLRYADGLDGSAEAVSSRIAPEQGPQVDIEQDHSKGKTERGANPGTNKQPYSNGENPEFTTNGVRIYGT